MDKGGEVHRPAHEFVRTVNLPVLASIKSRKAMTVGSVAAADAGGSRGMCRRGSGIRDTGDRESAARHTENASLKLTRLRRLTECIIDVIV